MIFTRIFILSFFIVYSNKYSSEQFSELTDLSNKFVTLFNERQHEFRAFFEAASKVAVVVLALSAGAFCGVAPFVFRAKKARAENYKSSSDESKNVGETKASTDGSSGGVSGHFVAMTGIRSKISCFRDLLDFSPCLGSATLLQLLILTLNDIFQRYPQIKPVSDFENATFDKALKIFCDSLKSLGDLWTIENWMVKCRYDSSMRLEHVELESVAILMLEDIIKLARERLYDEMDDDEDMESYSPPANAFSKAFDSYSDCTSYSGSPVTPTSVLPGSWSCLSASEEGSYSPPMLLPLRVQAARKLSPIDIKRLSFHMLPHGAQYMMNEREEEEREFEQYQEDEVMRDMEMIDVVVHTPQMETDSKQNGKSCNVGINWIGDQARPYGAVPPPPPPAPRPITTPRNLEISPPTPPPPVASTNVVSPSSMAVLNCPPPPPPPPPPTATSQSSSCPPPPPPPPSNGNGPAMPPPPPPMAGQPAPKGNGSAPPPPPSVSCLRPKKLATKLKRSSQMGTLYRTLKGKVEGATSPVKSPGRKGIKVGGGSPTGGKQGMADALAEMTKRSSYFIQIEEDVKTYEGVIKELKTAISSFQTSDMSELVKFHKHVESHLEKLTDETQVLARFEDFPSKKLEAIRMASSLHLKLDSIVSTLQSWQVIAPVGKLLDKAEGYFSKIKVELDALERTKDEEMKRFEAQKIKFDFVVLIRIKELLVDVSSNCMELALKEKRQAMNEGKTGTAKILWRAFQFAFRVYTFAGGHDDRADELTREVAHEIETQN